MAGFKSQASNRRGTGTLLTVIFLLAIAVGGFHSHHDGQRHGDCSVCHFAIECNGPFDESPAPLSAIRITTDVIPRENVTTVSLFELYGFCFPNAPPHRFS